MSGVSILSKSFKDLYMYFLLLSPVLSLLPEEWHIPEGGLLLLILDSKMKKS